jgi:hypothetical protein
MRRRAPCLPPSTCAPLPAPSDNWDGSEYKGSRWNILTLLAALFFLVPVGGLVFAWQTFGVLWG